MIGAAVTCDSPEAAIDRLAASWTTEVEDGRVLRRSARRVSHLDLYPLLTRGPACAGRGLPRPEPGADAGPAAPRRGAALSKNGATRQRFSSISSPEAAHYERHAPTPYSRYLHKQHDGPLPKR